ncbi:MAG: trypsin-like peptidase domain-containing protein [Vicinamibacterales bacterium]
MPPHVAVCRCGARQDDVSAPAGPGEVVVADPTVDEDEGPGRSVPLWTVPVASVLAIVLWNVTRPGPPPTNAQVPTLQDAVAAPPPAEQRAPAVPAPGVAPPEALASLRIERPLPPPAEPASGHAALEDVVAQALGGVVMIETSAGRGTGFFVAADLVVSNDHVVGRDTVVTVRMNDGSTRRATVERTAPEVDLALVRVPPEGAGATILTLGRAGDARVGQEVIAIGSALGLQSTVTRGILSAKRRSGAVAMLQTDAAINPGNSGGPLLDRDGVVLGVTTLKMAGQAEGLGFAVAADHVRALLDGRPTTGSGTPMPAPSPPPSQAGPPVGTQADTGGDDRRAANLAALDRELDTLARHAAQVDDRWARFDELCRPSAVRDGDRPWFGLAERPTSYSGRDRSCAAWLRDLETMSREFSQAMRALGESTRRAGLYPGDLRERRRQHRLDWTGFDR